jgi:hypothetical protein
VCDRGERKRKRLLDVENLRGQEIGFSVLGEELESVDCFNYLGRPIAADGNDWPAVVTNINKARGRWARVSRVLTREGTDPKVAGYFYKAVCQSVLLYGCETWVISKAILGSLEGFHHQIARRLSRHPIRLDPESGECVYPEAGKSLEMAGLHPMSTYIGRRQEYLLNWVQNRPLYTLCKDLVGGAGGPHCRYWWHVQTSSIEDTNDVVSTGRDRRAGSPTGDPAASPVP